MGLRGLETTRFQELGLLLEVFEIRLPIFLCKVAEVSENPTVLHPTDPQTDGSVIEITPMREKLIQGKVVGILATHTVVLPTIAPLTIRVIIRALFHNPSLGIVA